MVEFGTVHPYDDDTVREMVDAACAEWTVDVIEPIERGTDAVFSLSVSTPEGSREVVLKAAEFVDAERFVAEPGIVDAVDRATDVPVPTVIGTVTDDPDPTTTDTPDLPTPYFLMDRCPGVNGNDLETGEDGQVQRAGESGRHLAALHELDAGVEAFGHVESTDGGFTVRDRTGTWSAYLASKVPGQFEDRLRSGRFGDLWPEISTALEQVFEALPPVEACLLHNDWRPGNLLVDPDSGAITAVLDWGSAIAGHVEWELAMVEQGFVEWRAHDTAHRERVREALYRSYESRRTLDRDTGFEWRRAAYLLVSRVVAMQWFTYWNQDASAEKRDEMAAIHRDAFHARRARLDALET